MIDSQSLKIFVREPSFLGCVGAGFGGNQSPTIWIQSALFVSNIHMQRIA